MPVDSRPIAVVIAFCALIAGCKSDPLDPLAGYVAIDDPNCTAEACSHFVVEDYTPFFDNGGLCSMFIETDALEEANGVATLHVHLDPSRAGQPPKVEFQELTFKNLEFTGCLKNGLGAGIPYKIQPGSNKAIIVFHVAVDLKPADFEGIDTSLKAGQEGYTEMLAEKRRAARVDVKLENIYVEHK